MNRAGDDGALAVVRALCESDGRSLHALTRRLGLSLSQLQRLLTALGPDPRFDGLDLIEVRQQAGRSTLWLTARGRALCQSA